MSARSHGRIGVALFGFARLRSSCRSCLARSLVLLAAALFFAGCRHEMSEPVSEEVPDAARTEIERGPLRVLVEVTPSPARLSDEPTLTLTLDAEAGVEVVKPPFGDAMGDFNILDFHQPLPVTRGDRRIVQQIYTLEPQRTGTLQIDPIPVRFKDSRPDGDGQEHALETEALAIEVTSLADDQAPSLDDVNALAGPLGIPEPAGTPWWMFGGAILILPVLGAGLWVLRRRKAVPTAQQLSPQELAYLELERLMEAGLSERDIKRFYVELTGIVRRYIERTTGVQAAEQTTEEFLREISVGDVFSATERERLAAFLESADLVKFAAHEPLASDIEATFERAKAFLGLDAGGTAA